MDVDRAGDLTPAAAGPREYRQWLTCTQCAVAWVGRWSQEACWCCDRTEHVRLRWAVAA